MELMLPDYECLAFPPSMRAAAALCLAMKITDRTPWVSIQMVNSLNNLNSFFCLMSSFTFTVLFCAVSSPLFTPRYSLCHISCSISWSNHLAIEICQRKFGCVKEAS